MPNTPWKAIERKVAAVLGGRRIGVTGRATADVVVGSWLRVEVKHRKRLPAWIQAALDQARAGAGAGQVGVAVLHGRGERISDSWVIVRLDDFVDWFVGAPAGDGDEQ